VGPLGVDLLGRREEVPEPELLGKGQHRAALGRVCELLEKGRGVTPFKKQGVGLFVSYEQFRLYAPYDWKSLLDMLARYSSMEDKLQLLLEREQPSLLLRGRERVAVAEVEHTLSAAHHCL
jgi:hypothetical protein